ncbi:MAG: hypothetical protein V7K48_14820 [Nostoc sp.]|uniref:hypothetical protein n=1 Tax=Nostoc sp. TaxID=1180 RepID=UPI002FF7255E
MAVENSSSTSLIAGVVNTQKLGLLGHSFGGAVGLSAIADRCLPRYCQNSFTRPKELLAGAFYETGLQDQNTLKYIPINNSGIGVALLQGDLKGRVLPNTPLTTYDQIQTPPKAFINISGTNHFSITNINNVPGAIPDPVAPTLDKDVTVEMIACLRGYLEHRSKTPIGIQVLWRAGVSSESGSSFEEGKQADGS